MEKEWLDNDDALDYYDDYRQTNALSLTLTLIFNIIYIVVCCMVKTSIDKKDIAGLQLQKNYWVYAVLAAFTFELIGAYYFGHVLTVILDSLGFVLCIAWPFYYCIGKHEENLQN